MIKIRAFSFVIIHLCLSRIKAFILFHPISFDYLTFTGLQRNSCQIVHRMSDGTTDEEEKHVDAVSTSFDKSSLDTRERAWRYVKKPLLRIGAKGCSKSHGNSLRQLLADHVLVKVKVNTNKYGTFNFVMLSDTDTNSDVSTKFWMQEVLMI
jgi:hypothetical protein